MRFLYGKSGNKCAFPDCCEPIFEDDGTLTVEVLPRAVVLNKIDCEDKNAYVIDEIKKVNATLPSFMRVNKNARNFSTAALLGLREYF